MKRLLLVLVVVPALMSSVVLSPVALAADPSDPSDPSQSSSGSATTLPSGTNPNTFVADETNRGRTQIAATHTGDEPMFYAYLGEMPEASSGPVADMIVSKVFPGKSIQDTPLGMQKFRPMLQWRHWANQRYRFPPVFLFCLLVSCVMWIPFGRHLEPASALCKQKFWRSLFAGVLVFVLSLFFARLMFLSGLGWPAGVLTVALTQLALVAGLVVAVNLVGEAIARVIRVTHIRFVTERPMLQRSLFLLIGAFVLAGVILIPGPMDLPPIGTRLIMLFALLGLGALYKSKFDVARD
jgi:hypothetical protein